MDNTIVPAQPGAGVAASPDQAVIAQSGANRGMMLPGQNDESILRHYWRVLLKRYKLIAAIVGLALAIGIALAFLTKPMYAAVSTIEIARQAASVVDMDDAKPVQANDPEFYQTQYSLLQSRSLAERVVEDLRLGRDEEFLTNYGDMAPADLPESREGRTELATAILMDNTEIQPVRLSSVVNIKYNSPDPLMATKVANSYAKNFIDASLERRYEASSYARDFLQERLAEIRDRLESSERQAVTYAGQNELIDISPTSSSSDASDQPSQSLVGATLAEANSALATARANRIAAENEFRQATSQPVEALSNPALNTLRSSRAELSGQLQKLRADFGPEYPATKALVAQIRELDSQIGRESGRISSTISGSLRSNYQEAVANEKQLSALVEQLKSGVIDQRRRGIQYNIYQREVDTNRALYDALLQRYKEIGIAGGVGTNNVSIVDEAVVPTAPYSPNLMLNILLSLLIGSVLGAGLALLIEQLDESAVTPDQFEAKLGIPLLGSTPRIDDGEEPVELLNDPKTPMSEAYFSALTGLRFSTNHGTPRTLVVTSSQANEGKTTTSYAIASSLARVGKRVLLIDGDMRNPSIHKFMEMANLAGTSNLLIGEGSIQEYSHPTELKGLHVMTSGPIPPNPAELLAGDGIQRVLTQATQLYDHIVIDAPPVLGLADAPLLANAAEGTVFIMESGRTSTSQAAVAIKRLMTVNTIILGAILTKHDSKKAGYGYGYGYDYDYGSDHGSSKTKVA